MGSGCAWNNCGCSTVYTDAWGNPVNTGPFNPSSTASCSPDWGLLAMGALVAVGAMVMASAGRKKA